MTSAGSVVDCKRAPTLTRVPAVVATPIHVMIVDSIM
jgi:hypothetical protein